MYDVNWRELVLGVLNGVTTSIATYKAPYRRLLRVYL